MQAKSRLESAVVAAAVASIAVVVLGSCGKSPATGDRLLAIDAIERLFQDTRALRDQIDVTQSRGADESTAGVSLTDLVNRYDETRAQLQRALSAGARPPLQQEDMRAQLAMRQALEIYLDAEEIEPSPVDETGGAEGPIGCTYDPETSATGADGNQALSERIYSCFADAGRSLSLDGEKMDRLTIFGLLSLTDDSLRRERLWMALAPIWEAVNGDNGPRSPYRTLIRRNSALLKQEGKVLGESVRGIGVEPAVMEEWLTLVLQQWHDITPDSPIEPWDFSYDAGRGNRALSEAIPVGSLRPINDRFYRELGADPVQLRVQYDIEPRASKDPVAFTTFGRRPRREGNQWILGEPWVFASYQIGGLDNLLELLHETGHAIHINAIRTRPAFTDWPDSDIFTEGVADIATWEMYEPAWQQRYLGVSVPIRDGIAAKYAAIAMDIAWALFEVRVHRAPERDPNEVWTEITQKFFRIEPHPDRAWWAVRGQLIDSPGYMMNYAAGAILNADLRARAVELYGPYTEGDPDWYDRISRSLYRFGLEKTSKDVIEEFLGRPISPQALLDDMARAIAEEPIE
jgi:hypothetical protein